MISNSKKVFNAYRRASHEILQKELDQIDLDIARLYAHISFLIQKKCLSKEFDEEMNSLELKISVIRKMISDYFDQFKVKKIDDELNI